MGLGGFFSAEEGMKAYKHGLDFSERVAAGRDARRLGSRWARSVQRKPSGPGVRAVPLGRRGRWPLGEQGLARDAGGGFGPKGLEQPPWHLIPSLPSPPLPPPPPPRVGEAAGLAEVWRLPGRAGAPRAARMRGTPVAIRARPGARCPRRWPGWASAPGLSRCVPSGTGRLRARRRRAAGRGRGPGRVCHSASSRCGPGGARAAGVGNAPRRTRSCALRPERLSAVVEAEALRTRGMWEGGSRRGEAESRENSRWRASGCIWDLAGGDSPLGEQFTGRCRSALGPGDEIKQKGSPTTWLSIPRCK